MTKYKRPPITEAVIEIRLDEPLNKEKVEKLHERLKNDYSSSDHLVEIEVRVELKQPQATADELGHGYKLASEDQADTLLIMPNLMACSRLAPYNGWEKFRARAEENWTKWKKSTGYKKIQRLGTRYINRIDIPAADVEKIKIEDYLKVYPEYPESELPSGILKYTMQIAGPIEEGNLGVIINSSVIRSPLVDHLSVVLDIDVSLTSNVPQKDGEIWEIFDLMRVIKNRVFESCVTDNARKLFDK